MIEAQPLTKRVPTDRSEAATKSPKRRQLREHTLPGHMTRALFQRQRGLCAGCLALAIVFCACISAGGHGVASVQLRPAGVAPSSRVGSFDFPESVLLAYIYGGALAAPGFPVRVLPDLGTRELVDPALMSGLVQVVPEYSGSALEFLSVGTAVRDIR